MRHELINVTSLEQCTQAIQATIDNTFTPTLAFVFASIQYDLEALNRLLGQYDFITIGASTDGEIFADESLGVHTVEQTITIMLLDVNPHAIALKSFAPTNTDFFELGQQTSAWALERFDAPALLIVTAGLLFDCESYVQGVQTSISSLFGASAADDRTLTGTYVFSGTELLSAGTLVLAIDTHCIDVTSSLGFGWSGIGPQRLLTKSFYNVVYTIDDQPALNFYKNYLNLSQEDMPHRGGDYPLEIELPSGQIYYRAPLGMNEEDGSLIFAGHVEQNAKVRISAPIGRNLIDQVGEQIQDTQERRADFTLIFPCTSHKKLLGSFSNLEIEKVYRATHHAPMIGFYTYGEITSSSLQERALHNQSIVTLQLTEKSPCP
ncbi:MAG TPA: hypothetical protein ENK86_02755 [Campylobacterales bacterium]|nr:hypothetical protein [Campylobacterales bacterium]